MRGSVRASVKGILPVFLRSPWCELEGVGDERDYKLVE